MEFKSVIVYEYPQETFFRIIQRTSALLGLWIYSYLPVPSYVLMHSDVWNCEIKAFFPTPAAPNMKTRYDSTAPCELCDSAGEWCGDMGLLGARLLLLERRRRKESPRLITPRVESFAWLVNNCNRDNYNNEFDFSGSLAFRLQLNWLTAFRWAKRPETVNIAFVVVITNIYMCEVRYWYI